MQAERRDKPITLKELAESVPTKEELGELRAGFGELLSERGQAIDPMGGIAGKLAGKRVVYSGEVEIEGQSIPVLAFIKKSRHPDRDTLYVDIGMRSGSGERVRLAVPPKGDAYWLYLDRSLIGQGIKAESPSRNDISLHRQVLELIQTPQE